MNYKIEQANLTDLPKVLDLVKQLAEFEKEPNAVTVKIEEYNDALNEKKILIYVAKVEVEIIGMIIMYDAFSTWKGKILYLEDFYIEPKYRRQGIGQALFDKYIEIGRNGKYKKLKWQVLDWNTSAIDFYKRYDAIIETNWWNGTILL